MEGASSSQHVQAEVDGSELRNLPSTVISHATSARTLGKQPAHCEPHHRYKHIYL